MKELRSFAIYWHKGMNSGLWSDYTYDEAHKMAALLAKQKNVYDVQVIEYNKIEKVKEIK